LLHPEEQALLRRLAVFTGGCSVEAVEAVCGGADVPDGDLIERLGGLVDQSLLRRQSDEDGEPRLAMLETVREYAAERLTAAGEVAAVEERHAAYYLALAEAARAR
jgi:predicted ATPase